MRLTYRCDTSRMLAKICLENSLYEPKGVLDCWFRQMRAGTTRYGLVVAYHKGTPVGVLARNGKWLGFYVRPEYRRKGVAKRLFRKFISSYEGERSGLYLNGGFPYNGGASLAFSLGISFKMLVTGCPNVTYFRHRRRYVCSSSKYRNNFIHMDFARLKPKKDR
jgi:GNAT superfamily N-acetyltransferase